MISIDYGIMIYIVVVVVIVVVIVVVVVSLMTKLLASMKCNHQFRIRVMT